MMKNTIFVWIMIGLHGTCLFADEDGRTLEQQIEELRKKLSDRILVYGRANVSADYLDNGDDYREMNLSSNSSRLGFRTERNVAANLTALLQIEQGIFLDDEGGVFATRDSFVGFKGDWGMLRIGKFNTPFKNARAPVNFFGDQLGDMRNILRTIDHGRYDERFRNSLHYRSPDLAGFVWDLQYSNERGQRTTRDGHDANALSTSLGYSHGVFKIALAYEAQYDGNRVPDAVRVAVSYYVASALRIAALYQNTENAVGIQADAYGAGFQWRLAKQAYLNAHLFRLDSERDDKDAYLYAAGLEYRLDRALRMYCNIAAVTNDDDSELTPWQASRSATPPASAGKTAHGISLGMRYDF